MAAVTLDSLRAVFGAQIPADQGAALRLLEHSPLAPSDPAQRASLRAAVLAHLGERINDLRAAYLATTAHGQPVTTEHRPAGGQLAAMLAAKAGEAGAAVKAPSLQRAISEARARELFARMAAAPDIPHDFIDDGCMFRAHVVAKRLEEAGVFSEKIVCQTDGGDLRINSPKAAIGFSLAMFHVATAVYVKTEAGKIEERVIDPSLCDRPVTPEEWMSHMEAVGGGSCGLRTMPRFCLMPYDADKAPTTWKQEDLDDALAWNVQYREVQKTMLETGFYDHLKELVANPPEPVDAGGT